MLSHRSDRLYILSRSVIIRYRNTNIDISLTNELDLPDAMWQHKRVRSKETHLATQLTKDGLNAVWPSKTTLAL